MFSKGDFHIHSTASDGYLSPGEVIKTAKSRGVDVVAITDHNTTNGISEAVEACRQLGVSIIPGVELSTRHNADRIHILGYFRNALYLDDTFQYSLKAIKNHDGNKVRKLFKDYMNTSSSSSYLSVQEGINLLRLYGAVVVLAHPVRINKKSLQDILHFNFDGIEAKYCHNTDEDTSYFINLALTHFPFYTGGSDFHTNKKRDLTHCIIGEPYLNPMEIQRFLQRSGVILLG